MESLLQSRCLLTTASGGNPRSAPPAGPTQAVAVTVTDVDETGVSAPVDADAGINTVLENSAAGTSVGITATASDADASNTAVTFSLTNTAGGRFVINATTGVVSVAAGAVLDFEAATPHGIVLRALSADGSTSDTAYTIVIGDVAETVVLLNKTSAANTLTGGNDTLSGLGGGDVINGGIGNDLVNGGSGNDIIDGGVGTDILNRNGDNDLLLIRAAEAATDQMSGGDGISTIRVAAGCGIVTPKNLAANDIETSMAAAKSFKAALLRTS